MERLIEALEGCGEAAFFYKGQSIVIANGSFAKIFGRSAEEMRGVGLLDLCHNESIEMIRDYMHRRALGDPGIPTSYEAFFTTADRPRVGLRLNVLRIKGAEGAVLVLVRESS